MSKANELLKEALSSLDAIINAGKPVSGLSAENDRIVASPSSRQDHAKPMVNTDRRTTERGSEGQSSSERHSQPTKSWASRHQTASAERQYRRDQTKHMNEKIQVAWSSPTEKTSPKLLRVSSPNLLDTSSLSSINTSGRMNSVHEQNTSATMVQDPRRSGSPVVVSTKYVTESWGSKWGLRGSSPTPIVNEHAVFTTVKNDSDGFRDSTSYMNVEMSSGNDIASAKVVKHTEKWVRQRREMTKAELLLSGRNKIHADKFAVPGSPHRRVYNHTDDYVEYDEEKDANRLLVLKDRCAAAKLAVHTAHQTKLLNEMLEENECALQGLVGSLPSKYQTVVKQEIERSRNNIAQKWKNNSQSLSKENVCFGAPNNGLPTSHAEHARISKKLMCFHEESFQAHLKRIHLARDRAEKASNVFLDGSKWTKSPTKCMPFRLSMPKPKVEIKNIDKAERKRRKRSKRKLKKSTNGGGTLAQGEVQTVMAKSNSAPVGNSHVTVPRKFKKRKKKNLAKQGKKSETKTIGGVTIA